MSNFWSWFVIILVVINIVGFSLLTWWFSDVDPSDPTPEGGLIDLDIDGIQEYNRRMPRWLSWMFWISLIYCIGYLIVYPGMGVFPGLFGWTSTNQWKSRVEQAAAKYDPLFEQFQSISIPKLSQNPKAMKMTENLFMSHCSNCHGADGKGSVGFPNLTNGNWLFGGTPADITASITEGRHTIMPPMGAVLGSEKNIDAVVTYVRSLNGYKVDEAQAAIGEAKFKQTCVACHGPDAKGNKIIGSADLTNNKWIFGGSVAAIKETIMKGRQGVMPEHKDTLSKAKIHLLAAYVYNLSHGKTE